MPSIKLKLTPKVREEIIRLRKEMTIDAMAAHFEVNRSTINEKLKIIGIKLTPEEKKAIAAKYYKPRDYKKGQKRADSPLPGALRSSMFKGKRRHFIFTDLGWEPLNRFLWKQAGNDIPKGYVVGYKDLNSDNCVLENLYLRFRGNWNKRKPTGRNPRKYNPDKNKKRDEAARERRLIKQSERERTKDERDEKRKQRRRESEQAKKERAATKAEKTMIAKNSRQWLNPNKRKEKRYQTKPLDLSTKIAVRLDHKTIIFVNPGQDIEEVKARYKKAS